MIEEKLNFQVKECFSLVRYCEVVRRACLRADMMRIDELSSVYLKRVRSDATVYTFIWLDIWFLSGLLLLNELAQCPRWPHNAYSNIS